MAYPRKKDTHMSSPIRMRIRIVADATQGRFDTTLAPPLPGQEKEAVSFGTSELDLGGLLDCLSGNLYEPPEPLRKTYGMRVGRLAEQKVAASLVAGACRQCLRICIQSLAAEGAEGNGCIPKCEVDDLRP